MKVPSVFFYLPENDDVYFDAPLVLAEGLTALGIPFTANRNYWQLRADSPATLFQRVDGRTHHDADVVVIHDDWFYHYPQSTLMIERRDAPPDLFRSRRNYKLVYIDTWVGARTNSWDAQFRHCDLILRTQFNRRAAYPSNMKPWVLSFTNRIVAACAGREPFVRRRQSIVENFGYTHPFGHGVREIFTREIAPRIEQSVEIDRARSTPDLKEMSADDRLMWRQTVDKHNPDYFARLGSSTMVAAFCGYLAPALPADATVHFRGEKRFQALAAAMRLLSSFSGRRPRLIQWDSWRFWEALCAGAVPLHLDLEKYGAALPVMPTNGLHYVGLDLERRDEFLAATTDLAALERIAQAGREWALEHYSPRAMAMRFLSLLGLSAAGDTA